MAADKVQRGRTVFPCTSSASSRSEYRRRGVESASGVRKFPGQGVIPYWAGTRRFRFGRRIQSSEKGSKAEKATRLADGACLGLSSLNPIRSISNQNFLGTGLPRFGTSPGDSFSPSLGSFKCSGGERSYWRSSHPGALDQNGELERITAANHWHFLNSNRAAKLRNQSFLSLTMEAVYEISRK